MDHLTANHICPATSVFQVLVIRLLPSEGPTNGLQEANIVSVRLSTVPKEDRSNYLWVTVPDANQMTVKLPVSVLSGK
jgi:hypothetical protein